MPQKSSFITRRFFFFMTRVDEMTVFVVAMNGINAMKSIQRVSSASLSVINGCHSFVRLLIITFVTHYLHPVDWVHFPQ